MGWKYEVHGWYQDQQTGEHRYQVKHCGNWFVIALWEMYMLHKNGVQCVKLESRI